MQNTILVIPRVSVDRHNQCGAIMLISSLTSHQPPKSTSSADMHAARKWQMTRVTSTDAQCESPLATAHCVLPAYDVRVV